MSQPQPQPQAQLVESGKWDAGGEGVNKTCPIKISLFLIVPISLAFVEDGQEFKPDKDFI